MKQFYSTLLILMTLVSFLGAQTDVTLNINHKLGDQTFAFNSTSTNNMGHTFEVDRLEYYVSEISVVHDGGMETMISDLYLLIDASESATTTVDLGNINVTSVEAIKFHIGVDQANNHSNPATWPAGHPLAPTSPSMHWGWTAGYRFIAYEGYGGSNLNQLFELHGLGDSNYFTTEVAYSASAADGALSIDLDADYARGLEGIALNGGVIVHGESGAARTALENFRDYVFTPTTTSVSTVDISEVSSFSIFPNPAEDGTSNFMIESIEDLEYEVSVVDILGREIDHFYNVRSNTQVAIQLENSGIYMVNLIKEGQTVLNRKLVVR